MTQAPVRIVVFGAGGFVGGWICEALSQRTDINQVACVRHWASAVRLARRGIHLEQVDLENSDALPPLLTGVDVVVNAAMLPPAREAQIVTALYSACITAGVRRYIQLSSAAVYGKRDGMVDEAIAPAPGNAYASGKVAMEQSLSAMATKSPGHVFILRPSIIYGPYSSAWTVRYVERIISGRWRRLGRFGEGTCNLIHGHDLAKAVIAAATGDIARGLHVLNVNAPNPGSWNEYIERIGDSLDLPNRSTPGALKFRGMAIAAGVLRMGAKLDMVRSAYRRSAGTTRLAMKNAQSITKLYPTSTELDLLARKVHYSADRATRILGPIPAIPLEEGLRQSAAWCRIHGVI